MRAIGRRVLRLRPDTQCRVEDAAAVRAGRQASWDPPSADGSERAPRFVKRLVDGAWIVDSPTGHPDARGRGGRATAPRATCALCGAAARDAALDGWHVFDDPSGDEHVLCRACLSDG
jgi:hypothetical protein